MLERARADAEEATQAHSEFLANMSREIRDPLTTLLGTADALVGSRADDGGPVGEQLHVIRRCAERLLGMVNDLLDLSRAATSCRWTTPRPFPGRSCATRGGFGVC